MTANVRAKELQRKSWKNEKAFSESLYQVNSCLQVHQSANIGKSGRGEGSGIGVAMLVKEVIAVRGV